MAGGTTLWAAPNPKAGLMSTATATFVDGYLPDHGDDDADLSSHDSFTSGVPHATFSRLRREDPVHWTPEADGSGFWSVTRYHDALAVSRDVETFTSSRGIRLEEMDDDELEARRTMMELDPPEHTRLRRLVNRGFTRRTVESYEDSIRALAAEVLDEALTADAFDFVTEVAAKLPMRMLGRLLGTSDADGHQLVEWGDAFLGNSDPEFTTHVIDTADTEEYRLMPFRSPAAIEVFDYAERQAAGAPDLPPQRRDHPAAGPHPRRRAPQRPGVQELLHPADRRRQRHHPLHHDSRPAHDDAPPRPLAGLAGRPVTHRDSSGGDPAHQRGDHALPPHRHP